MELRIRKCILSGIILCFLLGNISGCGLFYDRGEYLAETNRTDKEMAEELMQSIIDALEAKDTEALKGLFSVYARENAYDLDGKIEELMDFYPGSEGGYEGNVCTHETAERGKKIYVIMVAYTVTHENETYEMSLTTQIENDMEPDKVGLYTIQVMTEEAEPDGFKWKDEEDAPGIYVLE